jgi:hypothetical protein
MALQDHIESIPVVTILLFGICSASQHTMSCLSDYEQGKDLFHVPQDCPLDAQSIHNLCDWQSGGDVHCIFDMILLIEQEFDAFEAHK